jgi:hypothetical protein
VSGGPADPGTLPDVVAEAQRLLALADARGTTLRALGGVAIRLHTARMPAALARDYADIDFVTARGSGRATARLFADAGYEPDEEFNLLHGAIRQLFHDRRHGRQVDVFVDRFEMCHRIPVAGRLEVEAATIPLAELLLTKLQIVELNEKDVKDILTILVEHDVGDHDAETINGRWIAKLLASDWGLWRTCKGTIEAVRAALAGSGLEAADRRAIERRLSDLWAIVEAQPKALRWRARARVGERATWYAIPEEVRG